MPTAYWGVAEVMNIAFPDTWQAWLLLSGYLALIFVLLFHERADMQGFTWRKWIGWLSLGVAALVTSLSFPVSIDPQSLPLLSSGWQPITVFLLAAIPALLAGITLGPGPALLVGMSSGLGQAIGRSHQPFDLFHYAFGAWIAACLLRNGYQGRMYGALRFPSVSGAIGFGSIAIMAGFAAFVSDAELSFLGRLDIALATVQAEFMPLLIEGLLGGLAVALLMLVKPAWKNNKNLAPSPMQRSVSSYLLTHMFVFGSLVLVIAAVATFMLASYLTVRQVSAEMAAGSIATSAQFKELQAQMEEALLTDSADELLDAAKAGDRTLGRIYVEAKHYDKVMLIDNQRQIASAYPSGTTTADLTEPELAAAESALRHSESTFVLSDSIGEHSSVSLVVPVYSVRGESAAALVGRISEQSLTDILASLAASSEGSSGAIVNRDGLSVAHIGEETDSWYVTGGTEQQPLNTPAELGGRLLLSKNDSGGRNLIYLTPWDSNNLRIAATVPFENVLSRALGLAAPLVLALLLVAGVFYFQLERYSRDLSGSIRALASSSRALGSAETPVTRPVAGRQDELGDLGRAFFEMQRGFKQRLDEQSLLLTVSRDASSSVDLADSLPIVLHGMLRATGAAGARALVLSPTRGQPYTFAEGPAAEGMGFLDRPLLNQLRSEEELALSNPTLIRQLLVLGDEPELAIKALYAIQLQIGGKFLGFLTVGFRQPGSLSQQDLLLMRSLADQASAIIEKSYLFANAEGGRRRLVAILKSTTEAVIVTDQTDRILIINRAMETAFNLDARQITGRAVADVIDSEMLVNALSGRQSDNRNLEVAGSDDRTYFANISPIINRDGHALGRVAVLHDITDLKKLDRLKSEFVDNVSHDLRTPLTVLSGYASALALLDDLTPEQREYADNILRSAEQMIALVENLLDLGRLEAGVEISFVETDVGQLLQDMADEHWLFAHESGIRMHVKVQENLPSISCDPGLVRQAVANLLTNGFKYAPDSGDMTLAAEMNGDRLVISVRDRGPGIAKKDQARLFEKFYRVKRHGAGKAKGSGLGLAIVKTIAERHGGEVWCYSEVGKGCTFFIALPAEPA